jgi:uncharacterized protein (DUF697 family)
MNQHALLRIYERLEGLIGRLPGPLQKAILQELSPVKQIFLAQRLAKICLLGQSTVDASLLFSALVEADLRMLEVQSSPGWTGYQQRGHGGFRILDARRLHENSLAWSTLSGALSEEGPDLLLFLADGRRKLEIGLECEQAARVIDFVHERHQKRVPLIGILDVPFSAEARELEAKRLELQAWLSGHDVLAPHFVRTLAVSSFVRFRADGSFDLERDQRRNISELAELITRELPGDAQVEMARLVHAKKTQIEIGNRLVRSISTICAAIGAQPIPLADLPVLTSLQIAMVSGLMHLSGRELSMKAATEFCGALGANLSVAMILRESARAAVKVFPGWGNAISGGIAGAGTYAIGRAAGAYFIEGVSLGEARRLFRRKKKQID